MWHVGSTYLTVPALEESGSPELARQDGAGADGAMGVPLAKNSCLLPSGRHEMVASLSGKLKTGDGKRVCR